MRSHGYVTIRVSSDNLSHGNRAIAKGDLHFLGTVHYMIVGDNMPIEIPDKAGAAAKGQQAIGVNVGGQRIFGQDVAVLC